MRITIAALALVAAAGISVPVAAQKYFARQKLHMDQAKSSDVVAEDGTPEGQAIAIGSHYVAEVKKYVQINSKQPTDVSQLPTYNSGTNLLPGAEFGFTGIYESWDDYYATASQGGHRAFFIGNLRPEVCAAIQQRINGNPEFHLDWPVPRHGCWDRNRYAMYYIYV